MSTNGEVKTGDFPVIEPIVCHYSPLENGVENEKEEQELDDKPKRKYTMSDKVKARNKKNGELLAEKNRIRGERLRNLSKLEKDVAEREQRLRNIDTLIDNRLSELINVVKDKVYIQKPLEPIEEEDKTYFSDGGSEYKRVNSRFNKTFIPQPSTRQSQDGRFRR